MSIELHVEDAAARPAGVAEPPRPDDRHPNVSGDLPGLLEVGPMFRRSAVGYDRFQVDTYVQWAEAAARIDPTCREVSSS
jgi:hypothetical protein